MAKYQKYAEYKDSGIEWLGEIPKSWNISRLKYIAEIFGRIGFRGYTVDDIVDEGEGALVLSPSNILGDQFSLDKKTYLSWKKYYESPEIMVGINDILLVKTGSTYGKSTIILEKKEPMTINPQMALLKKIKLESRFLYYLFQSTLYKAVIDISNTGSGMPTMTQENINSFPIPFPAFNEALNIANFLDHETTKIDTLISKQEKLIELLKEKRQAVISHAVTKGLNPNVPMKDSDVEWLGEVPEHWQIWKFSHIAPIITCGVASTPTYVDESEGMPFLSAQNIKNNKLSLHKFNYISHELHEQLTRYRRPEYGDILVTRVGAGIGEACVVDIDLEFSIYVSLTHIRVKAELAHNKFIMYFFGTDYCKFLNFDGTVTGGGVGNLNVNNVVRYKIALPSIEEQQQITEYLDNYINKQDELITKAESAIQLMQERRTALISAAVTCKIDVRNWQSPNKNNEADMELGT